MAVVECACCSAVIMGTSGDKCDGCKDGDGTGEGCNPADTWHCFTGHCDGSGCTYPGECEEDEDTFRDYHVGDRVKISENWGGSSDLFGMVEAVLDIGEVAVKPDGLPAVFNISPIYLTPAE